MSIDDTKLERLVYIKQIHNTAEQYSKKPQPLSSISLLLFHDSVEMFLQLASEHLGITDSYKFMEYWDTFEDKAGITLSGKSAMRRLNKARTTFKHQGNRPYKQDIESHYATVKAFFETNTQKIFDISYSDVYLTMSISFEEAREFATRAEEALESGHYEKCIIQSSAAYDSLMDEFDNRVQYELGYTPYPSIHPSPSIPPAGNQTTPETSNFAKEVVRKLEELYDSIRIISLDVDLWKHRRFQRLTPDVNSDAVPLRKDWKRIEITEDEAKFCIKFLTELAIELQNSELSMDSDPPDSPHTPIDEFT